MTVAILAGRGQLAMAAEHHGGLAEAFSGSKRSALHPCVELVGRGSDCGTLC